MALPTTSPRSLAVVGIGGDIGMYSVCRAFHEQYGVASTVLSTVATRAMKYSAFVENVVVPGLDDADVLLAALEEQARRLAGRTPVLLTNSDWHVQTIVRHRKRLEDAGYVVQYPGPDVLEKVSTKVGFAEVCARLGIPTPRTVPVDVAALAAESRPAATGELTSRLGTEVGFPMVAKPSDSSEWHRTDFPGKRKVHTLHSRDEVADLLDRLVAARYPGTLLVQEYIPGGETQVRSLTAYRDSHGEVTLLATGRVLLEEHTPGTLGIPAAILVEPYDDAMDAAARFLDDVGYVGFANFDFKRDPRDGRHVFFEVNPRIGRNNHYVTAAGVNVAKVLVEDAVLGRRLSPRRATAEVLFTVVPFRLLLRYVVEPELRTRLRRIRQRGGVVNPLRYPHGDGGVRRRLMVEAITQNYRRKYARYYPSPRAD
jgi:predicted ATP-grasp superfamily ATP-dependent carboligase